MTADDVERFAAWLEDGRQRVRAALWPETEGQEQERDDEGAETGDGGRPGAA